MACNAPLVRVEKDDVEHLLRPGTRRTYDAFMRCPDCGRVYWRGAHSVRLERIVAAAKRVGAVSLAASLLAFALASCAGSGSKPKGTPEPSRTTQGQVLSPFTGLPAKLGPVLAVKIDNIAPARPQTGLKAADIVYMEQVEGGLTRMLAVYSSHMPPRVGPVRSGRESDLELLRQFGRPAFAYSGVQTKLLPMFAKAPLYALPPEKAPGAYVRDGSRPVPHNLYLLPERALAKAPQADKASDIGFRFGAAPSGGRVVNKETVRYPAAGFTFTWSPGGQRWLVSMDGTAMSTTDGGQAAAATVVVQRVTIRAAQFRERGGVISPYSETVGSGKALVLRDGKAYDARWHRDDADSGTTFTNPSGGRLNFAKGPVWVMLVAR